jgi:hypothetical protein
MIFKRTSLQDYFFNSQVALTNAVKNEKIYPLISAYNMTSDKIDQGLATLNKLMTLDYAKTVAHGKQLEARAALYKLLAEIHPTYMEHVNFTKLKCLKNPARLGRMMLLAPRERTLNGWLRQAETFYTNLLDDTEMVAELENNAITLEKLNAAKAKIVQVEQANSAYNDTKGRAQNALEERDELLAEFDLWMREFIYVCKVALRDHKQLLESLKIQVLSKGYVRQKSESTPADNTVEVDSKTLPKKAEEAKTILANASTAAAAPELVKVGEAGSMITTLPGNDGSDSSARGSQMQQAMGQ